MSRALVRQIGRSAVASLAGWAVEITLLTAFVSRLHLHYLVGAALAASGFVLASWILNRVWAFTARTAPTPQLARHAVVVAASYAISLPLLWLLAGRAHLQYQLAWMIAGTSAFFVWTFPMHRLFTYRAAS